MTIQEFGHSIWYKYVYKHYINMYIAFFNEAENQYSINGLSSGVGHTELYISRSGRLYKKRHNILNISYITNLPKSETNLNKGTNFCLQIITWENTKIKIVHTYESNKQHFLQRNPMKKKTLTLRKLPFSPKLSYYCLGENYHLQLNKTKYTIKQSQQERNLTTFIQI